MNDKELVEGLKNNDPNAINECRKIIEPVIRRIISDKFCSELDDFIQDTLIQIIKTNTIIRLAVICGRNEYVRAYIRQIARNVTYSNLPKTDIFQILDDICEESDIFIVPSF